MIKYLDIIFLFWYPTILQVSKLPKWKDRRFTTTFDVISISIYIDGCLHNINVYAVTVQDREKIIYLEFTEHHPHISCNHVSNFIPNIVNKFTSALLVRRSYSNRVPLQNKSKTQQYNILFCAFPRMSI